MSTSKSLTIDDLLVIRDGYCQASKDLKNTIVFCQRELPQDRIDELWAKVNANDKIISDIEDQIFKKTVVDIEQPRKEIMKSIQKVEAKIRTLTQMNEGVDKLVKILKPFTTMMAMIFSPGGGFGIVKIAELLAEIDAVA